MTAAARPSLRGMAPFSVLGDGGLNLLSAGQSIRRTAGNDSWDFFTPVAFDDPVTQGQVLAGPVSGLPAAPTFRSLVQTDLPGSICYVPEADGFVPAGNTVQNTTTQTAFGSLYTIAANFLTIGTLIRVRARGTINTALAAVTYTFRVLYGGSPLVASTAVSVPASVTNGGFFIDCDAVVTAVGAGGTFEAQGHMILGNVSGNLKGADITMLRNTAPISLATTTAKNIAIDVQMGTAGATINAVLRILTVDIIRP